MTSDTHASSLRSVVVTIAIVATQAVLLGVLTAITGSATLFAETMFSVADVGVEALLLVGLFRSVRPPDADHPLGYGGEAFYWSLLAAVGLFAGGGVASLVQGVASLRHPEPGSGYLLAYLLLLVLLLSDGWALLESWRNLKRHARASGHSVAHEFAHTSDPAAKTVMAGNAAAVATAPVAILGLALHEATGKDVFDSVASMLIGVLLIGVALVLMAADRDLMSAPSVGPRVVEEIRTLVQGVDGVAGVARVTAVVTGPKQATVAVRAVFAPELDRDGVGAAIGRVEEALAARPGVVEAYVTPVAPEPPAPKPKPET